MLSYIKHLVVRGSGVQDDELQSITNYLTTVHEVAMLEAVCEVHITQECPFNVQGINVTQGN